MVTVILSVSIHDTVVEDEHWLYDFSAHRCLWSGDFALQL
jgi:hypothetical protein